MSLDGLHPIEMDRADTAAAKVARNLIQYLVVSRGVSLGERIPSERQLAQTLGAGRSAVREALKVLDLLGLIEIRQGGGTYLKSGDSAFLPNVIEWGILLGGERTHEAIEARLVIECALAGFAAERRTSASLERLESLIGEMHSRIDAPERFVEADVRFHLEVARAAQNDMLAKIHSSLHSLLRVWISEVISHQDRPLAALAEEHRPVLEAVRAGDRAAAEAAMREHLEAAGRRLAEALDDQAAGGEQM
jgi:GntR family transcriptional regulator, transcriptional repressor for pyruvate dehydrogenase complex